MYKEVESLLRALAIYNEVDKDDEICHMVTSKFPTSLLDWIAKQGVPELPEFHCKMKKIVCNREDVAHTISDFALPTQQVEYATVFLVKSELNLNEKRKSNRQPSSTISSNSNQNTTNSEQDASSSKKSKRPDPFCVFCKGPHYSSTCEKYATATDRLKALPPNSCIR